MATARSIKMTTATKMTTIVKAAATAATTRITIAAATATTTMYLVEVELQSHCNYEKFVRNFITL